MAGINTSAVDGPPPSPDTDPAAAQEVGRPASQVQQLIGGQKQAPGMGPGPDMSGLLMLGQKLVEGILTLAQAAPLMAPECDQAKELILNGLGKVNASAATGSGTSPNLPMGSPTPQQQQPTPPVTQAGAQFPGVQSGGKPF